jgi:uncharacterized protein (TIGR00645 family)
MDGRGCCKESYKWGWLKYFSKEMHGRTLALDKPASKTLWCLMRLKFGNSNMSAKSIFNILMSFRWLILVFCFGLAVALCGFGAVFVIKTYKFILAVPTMDEVEALLKILGLIDSALVAGLVVMVMLSSFSSFVENQDDAQSQSWLSNISFGALKLKLASTIAAIGAINLLEAVFEIGPLNANNILLQSAVELVFILVVVVFAAVDWMAKSHDHKN